MNAEKLEPINQVEVKELSKDFSIILEKIHQLRSSKSLAAVMQSPECEMNLSYQLGLIANDLGKVHNLYLKSLELYIENNQSKPKKVKNNQHGTNKVYLEPKN